MYGGGGGAMLPGVCLMQDPAQSIVHLDPGPYMTVCGLVHQMTGGGGGRRTEFSPSLLVCCAYVPDAWRLEYPLHRRRGASFLALVCAIPLKPTKDRARRRWTLCSLKVPMQTASIIQGPVTKSCIPLQLSFQTERRLWYH